MSQEQHDKVEEVIQLAIGDPLRTDDEFPDGIPLRVRASTGVSFVRWTNKGVFHAQQS